MTYAEKLKDPRWQRRRLEILSAANFTCQCCFSDEKTLHVHHELYRKGAQPWEYSDHELKAYCADCHKAAEETRNDLLSVLATVPENPSFYIAEAVRLILSRDHWMDIMHWIYCARYPDLMAEAWRRRLKECEQERAAAEKTTPAKKRKRKPAA